VAGWLLPGPLPASNVRNVPNVLLHTLRGGCAARCALAALLLPGRVCSSRVHIPQNDCGPRAVGASGAAAQGKLEDKETRTHP